MPDNPFVGQISLFAVSFAPRHWSSCGGQILPISQYTALFSLLGTTYGGDARTQFALPDLQGRTPIGRSTDRTYRLGTKSGQETVTLTTAQLPSHTHSAVIPVSQNTFPNATDDNTGYFQDTGSATFFSTTAGSQSLKGAKLETTGGNQPHENRQPYMALNYCIALQGVYPSRS